MPYKVLLWQCSLHDLVFKEYSEKYILGLKSIEELAVENYMYVIFLISGKKKAKPVNKDQFISKMFLRCIFK